MQASRPAPRVALPMNRGCLPGALPPISPSGPCALNRNIRSAGKPSPGWFSCPPYPTVCNPTPPESVLDTVNRFIDCYSSVHRGSRAFKGTRFAVIADEAHSSQTGDTAAMLKQVLSLGDLAVLKNGAKSAARIFWPRRWRPRRRHPRSGSNLPEKACEKPPATRPLTCQHQPCSMTLGQTTRPPSHGMAARDAVERVPAIAWNRCPSGWRRGDSTGP